MQKKNTERKKVTKPQAYFLLFFGIAFVIWGVKYNDIQHTISPSLFYFLAGLIYAATGFNMTKVTDEQIKEEEAALN